MEKKAIPRFLIGGTNSGCGKTTVTCAVLAALKKRGAAVQAFKCGPDYIDPMFHMKITGRIARNLDPFMLEPQIMNRLLQKGADGADLSVLEGVMGYYDGLGGRTAACSTYHAARITQTPAVLVVNGSGLSLSVAAIIKGYLDFLPANYIYGVILNQISSPLYPVLKEVLEDTLPVKVYGYLPKMPGASLESRHLGLVTAEEVERWDEKVAELAEQAEKSIDLDGLVQLAHTACEVKTGRSEPRYTLSGDKIRLAVARDKAFCFYYQDNLDLLEEMGAEIVPFSPLHDQELPEQIDGLYLGGGYPELFAHELSGNKSMLQSIREALERQTPCLAECGGFMYLHERLQTSENTVYPMVGWLAGEVRMTGKLSRFGYITLTSLKDCMLAQTGEEIKGHEFHYSDADDCGSDFRAEKPVGKKGWDCIHATSYIVAGYPHIHFWSNPLFARRFIEQCRKGRG